MYLNCLKCLLEEPTKLTDMSSTCIDNVLQSGLIDKYMYAEFSSCLSSGITDGGSVRGQCACVSACGG